MSVITNEQINEIRAKNDIVSVVSNYVPLVKKGKNYFGVCPFHDDHSPSMSVSSEKQIYTCFSCGASGNVFTFVSEYEHISFYDAVKLLGDKVGINIKGNYDKANSVNQEAYDIYEYASKFYQNNLNTHLGKNALNYLKERKIDDDIIEKFKIGLALNQVSVTDYLISKNYDLVKLNSLGITKDNGKDLFINRIMFPLFDLSGKVVAFSGRIYNTKDGSKYVNTKETKIFKKGHILYNYHNAKEHLKKNDFVIVMEGFLDVIRASTIGINNCVATMGTALTKENAMLLKKMTDNVILCFDGDKAGEDATNAAINVLEEFNIIPKIVRLEDNLDPDEYILKKGKEVFFAKINNPINVVDYKMSILKKDKNLNDLSEVSKYIDSALREMAKINDDILVELTLKKIETEYNVDYKSLYSKYEKYKKDNTKIDKELKVKIVNSSNDIDKYQKAQINLIYYMIKDQKVIIYIQDKVPYLPNDKLRYLFNEILSFYQKYGIFDIADFITYLNGKEEYATLKKILGMNLKSEYTLEEIDDYIYLINKYPKEIQIGKLEKKMKEEPDPFKQAQILSEIMKIKGVISNDRRN